MAFAVPQNSQNNSFLSAAGPRATQRSDKRNQELYLALKECGTNRLLFLRCEFELRRNFKISLLPSFLVRLASIQLFFAFAQLGIQSSIPFAVFNFLLIGIKTGLKLQF
jgi:hypothetical protein